MTEQEQSNQNEITRKWSKAVQEKTLTDDNLRQMCIDILEAITGRKRHAVNPVSHTFELSDGHLSLAFNPFNSQCLTIFLGSQNQGEDILIFDIQNGIRATYNKSPYQSLIRKNLASDKKSEMAGKILNIYSSYC